MNKTISDLRKQLEQSVPRSRYDACNQDWLNAKAELKEVRAIATAEIERLQKQLEQAEARFTRLAATSRKAIKAWALAQAHIPEHMRPTFKQWDLAWEAYEQALSPTVEIGNNTPLVSPTATAQKSSTPD